ncbi:hypothetical protein [Phormidesmis priestleyi]|uniref:hypothetical protein n=1 Tax=Phormidesmis priestleyi TaxID=268141 RepID=UPI0012E8CDC7|nr:hypothetical protein [Phormidesmis priestleyi]
MSARFVRRYPCGTGTFLRDCCDVSGDHTDSVFGCDRSIGHGKSGETFHRNVSTASGESIIIYNRRMMGDGLT